MYAIIRIQKLHGSDITASENHCERKTEVKNADPELTHLNFNTKPYHSSESMENNYEDNQKGLISEEENERFWTNSMPLNDSIKDYIEANKVKIPRSDSVKCVEIMMAAPPELFGNLPKNTLKNDPTFNQWVEANYQFVRTHFKEGVTEKVLSFHVHLDEKTPHIHAHIIPTHDGKLNAKHYFGGRDKMKSFQDSYCKFLNDNIKLSYDNGEKVEFLRGQPKEITGKRHIEIKNYYKNLDLAESVGITKENINNLIVEAQNKGLGERKGAYDNMNTFEQDISERKAQIPQKENNNDYSMGI